MPPQTASHSHPSMDVWPWIASLPSSPPPLPLSSSSSKTILLRSHKPSSHDDAIVTISLCIEESPTSNATKTLWTSDPFPTTNPFPPLLLHLLRDIATLSPSPSHEPPPPLSNSSDFPDLRSHREFPALFALVFLARAFWPLAFDPDESLGAAYLDLLRSALPSALACRHALRDLLLWAGPDWELLLVRALGYALAKLCVLRDVSSDHPQLPDCALAYAADVHGLWCLRGYAPVAAMAVVHRHAHTEAEAAGGEPAALRYALAHQHLEVVFQLAYELRFHDERFVIVAVRLDNLRVRVSRLRLRRGEDGEEGGVTDEKHFPSRVRLRVGPDPRSANSRGIAGLSLGRSTRNPWREVEREQRVKGAFAAAGKGARQPTLEAETRTATRARARGWRWEQEEEGNAAVFEGVLCDSGTGAEVASWRGAGACGDPRKGMRRRCGGPWRALSRSGGLVVAGDEVGELVSWRVGTGMEGEVLNWRIGGKVWLSYCANEVKSNYFETRCVEWHDVVQLPLKRRRSPLVEGVGGDLVAVRFGSSTERGS